ncbi:7523_t:CDS:10 [Gigaspora margarita]|uniref:phospholipase D n=1 Tax=Gigaspora margarita TaxID=4874 RepID=A0ABN7W1F7_GIGMA|nr:7523_t:CDS:10 [Gigaspora margarita]
MEQHPYGSFTSPKENVYTKWYVDAKDYYYAVSEALMAAKEEIFIEDWWLSPELKKANEGVKIYIVLFNEVPAIMYLNSRHAELALHHKNIKVFRHGENTFFANVEWGLHMLWNRLFPNAESIKHPDTDPVAYWTVMVVDRNTAFIGGLDLCFGRYDTHAHKLADFPKFANFSEVWPGQDYNNVRIKDFVEAPAVDVANHFIERWNYIKSRNALNYFIRCSHPLLKKSVASDFLEEDVRTYKYFNETTDVDSTKGTCSVQILRSVCRWSHGIEIEDSIHQAYVQTIKEAQHFIYIENQFFMTGNYEKSIFHNMIGKALIERIIRAYKNNEKFRVIVVMPLVPGFEGQFDAEMAVALRITLEFEYRTICRGDGSIFEKLKQAGIQNPDEYISFYALRTHDKIDSEAVKKAKDQILSKMSQELSSKVSPVLNLVNDPIITEQIYIHSKLMIVDDEIVICGSANVNDRSQLGRHDSEIAAIIRDKDKIDSKLAGKHIKASRFAVSLRRYLFKEHLGLLPVSDDHLSEVTYHSYPPPLHIKIESHHLQTNEEKKLEDPVSDEFYALWKGRAEKNTEIFNDVFHCLPSDRVKTWDDYKEFIPDPKLIPLGHVYDKSKIQELEHVKGNLVLFPYKFLEKEEVTVLRKVKTLNDLQYNFKEFELAAESELIEDLAKSSEHVAAFAG